MHPFIKLSKLVSVFCISIIILSSCASYRVKSEAFQRHLQLNETKKALADIDNNKFLKKNRNKLLYYLEKGRIAFLSGQYKISNELLNKADFLIEDNIKNIGNEALAVITNPETKTYTGEDFEKVLIHYYKSLNYFYLKQFDDALVEAKRINLSLQKINSQYPADKKNRYNNDAFSLILQGLLYESSGDINNAFISYRNATDLFIKNKGIFFGTTLPEQLKKDLLKTAKYLGFTNEYNRYSKLFGMKVSSKKSNGGELILFWETGLVPYKDQNMYAFTILPGKKDGIISVYNEELKLNLMLPFNVGNKKNTTITDLSIFNVAFPKYVERTPFFTSATVSLQGKDYQLETVENIENIAFTTLNNRLYREIGNAALRLASKKLLEYTARNENEYAGMFIGLVNSLTERADTRNWQSLPNKIYYCRIPLKKGDNQIELKLTSVNNTTEIKKFNIIGSGHLIFKNITNLKSIN